MKLPATAPRIVLPEVPASYRPRTAAPVVGLSRHTIEAAIKRGELGALKLGGCVLIPRDELQRWIDERAVPWRAS